MQGFVKYLIHIGQNISKKEKRLFDTAQPLYSWNITSQFSYFLINLYDWDTPPEVAFKIYIPDCQWAVGTDKVPSTSVAW